MTTSETNSEKTSKDIFELFQDPIFFSSFSPTLLKVSEDKVTCDKPEYNENAKKFIGQYQYILCFKNVMLSSINQLGLVEIFKYSKAFSHNYIQATADELISDPEEVKKILSQFEKKEINICPIYRKLGQRSSHISKDIINYSAACLSALRNGLDVQKMSLETLPAQSLSNFVKIFVDDELLNTVKGNTTIEYLQKIFKHTAFKFAQNSSLNLQYSEYDHPSQDNIDNNYLEKTNAMYEKNIFKNLKKPQLEFSEKEIHELSSDILLEFAKNKHNIVFNHNSAPYFIDFPDTQIKELNEKLNNETSVKYDSFINTVKKLQKTLNEDDLSFNSDVIVSGNINLNKLHQKIAPGTSMQFQFDEYEITSKHTVDTIGQVSHKSNINFIVCVGRYIDMAQEVIYDAFNCNYKPRKAFFFDKDGAHFSFNFGKQTDMESAKEIIKGIYENISLSTLENDDISKTSIQNIIMQHKIKKIAENNPSNDDDNYNQRKNSYSL